ncbi:MAG TPA: response regulator [Verrucomicrobiae bacterium]|nr:response regulator [Verrucomicrobiae bacterium]
MSPFNLSYEISVQPGEQRASAASVAACSSAPARILLLDDDPVLVRLMALLLKRVGYEVDTAGDGEQGWAALQRGQYDLLMTDNDMPRLKGLDLVRRIRAAGMSLPIIVVSASAEVRVLVNDGSPLVAAVVPKPFDPEDLLAQVGRAVPLAHNASAPGAFAA